VQLPEIMGWVGNQRNIVNILFLVSYKITLFSQKFHTVMKDMFEYVSVQVQYYLSECNM